MKGVEKERVLLDYKEGIGKLKEVRPKIREAQDVVDEFYKRGGLRSTDPSRPLFSVAAAEVIIEPGENASERVLLRQEHRGGGSGQPRASHHEQRGGNFREASGGCDSRCSGWPRA